ncbi:MAG: hypothetical protein ACYTDT_09515, partial [Planctomycetota bacterium]
MSRNASIVITNLVWIVVVFAVFIVASQMYASDQVAVQVEVEKTGSTSSPCAPSKQLVCPYFGWGDVDLLQFSKDGNRLFVSDGEFMAVWDEAEDDWISHFEL